MSLPFILDVAIGLLLVYLIISLLASEIQELLTTLLQWRAAHLRKSIENLLVGGEGTKNDETVKEIVKNLYQNPLIKNISQESKEGIEARLREIVRAIVTFGRNKKLTLTEGNEPSYIPSETFATTLLEILELPQFVKKLTVFNLQNFIKTEINSTIYRYVEDKNFQISDDISTILKADFDSLETTFHNIFTAFSANKATLLTTINRLKDELNLYIDKSITYLENVILSEQSGVSLNEQRNASTKSLITELTFFKKSIFYEDKSYNDTEELIQRFQPSLGQIMALITTEVDQKTEETNEIIKTIKLLRKESQKADIAKAYQALKIDIKTIANQLPLGVKHSLDALADRTQINLSRSQKKLENIEDELRQFKLEIEVWFDRSMERASGVYKRNAEGATIIARMPT